LIKILHSDGYSVSVEHFKDLISWKSTRAIEIKLLEDLCHGSFANQILRKVQVAVVFTILITVTGAQPFDKGGLA
jgi:hypothetical protein